MSEKLERHHRAHKLSPVGTWTYKGVRYAVAVGGPFEVIVPTKDIEWDIRRDHPNGFYEYSWTLFRDEKPWFGGSNIVDKYHDPEHTDAARERMRVNAARRDAEWAIDNAKAVLEAAA